MSCSLVMLAGPDDADHVRLLFDHAARTARFPFRFRALTLDTMPSSKFRTGGERLEEVANQMLAGSEIDAVFRTTDQTSCIELKHFGHRLKRKRDFRGIPLLGWAIGIERVPTDYVCHFDCDILMHSKVGYSWIAAGIEILESHTDVICVAPKGGPGKPSDPAKVKGFSSRRFLMDRRRLNAILPLPATHRSWKRRLLMRVGGASSYWPWETHMRTAIENSTLSSMYLGDPSAWTIHCPDHGSKWKANLEKIVDACERGTYPSQQAGNVELDLDLWIGSLGVAPQDA